MRNWRRYWRRGWGAVRGWGWRKGCVEGLVGVEPLGGGVCGDVCGDIRGGAQEVPGEQSHALAGDFVQLGGVMEQGGSVRVEEGQLFIALSGGDFTDESDEAWGDEEGADCAFM